MRSNYGSLTATTVLIPDDITLVTNNVFTKTISFGLYGLFSAANTVTNTKFLSMLSDEGAIAGPLVSTYQSVVLGLCLGILLSTGVEIGSHIGKREFAKAGDVAKASWILSAALGITATSLFLLTRAVFPLFFKYEVAKISFDYFSGYALGSIPILFLVSSPQIAFQAGDYYVPPIAMLLFASLSAVLSYIFGFQTNLGALGVGLGSSISALLVCSGMQVWFLRKKYHDYGFFIFSIHDPKVIILKLFSTGWKLSLQRLTEWGNLFLITTVIAKSDVENLASASPAIFYMILIGTTIQGVAQAAGMIITKNLGVIEKRIEEDKASEALTLNKKNYSILLKSNISGVSLGSIFFIFFYFFKELFVNLILPNNANPEIKKLAQTILWINILGFIPDSMRIISGGVLRGWKDILYPTLVSFFIMIIIGIPSAIGLSRLLGNEEKVLFWTRNVAITLAAFMLINRGYNRIKSDQVALENTTVNRASVQSDQITSNLQAALFSENNVRTADQRQTLTVKI